VTLKSIELIVKEYGVNMSLGASNVSFGLPDRHSVNSAFLALAIQAGVTTFYYGCNQVGEFDQGD
jgi:5-methyltetrahydrofolate--homocysteine methyltransferase